MTTPSQQLVLVADDEQIVREIVTAVLLKSGFAVVTATDGVEALASAEEHKSDLKLLITDLMMPRMDGLTLANQIRGICPQIHILFISGYNNLLAGVEATGYPFLQKPFSLEALLDSVRSVMATPAETQNRFCA